MVRGVDVVVGNLDHSTTGVQMYDVRMGKEEAERAIQEGPTSSVGPHGYLEPE